MIIHQYQSIKLLLLMMTGFLFFVKCTQAVKDYIPGVYMAQWTNEFSKAQDTILIEAPSEEGSGVYQITRRTYILYKRKPQYKLVRWTGTFNSANKAIIINNNGRILSFDPVKQEMKMGSTTYKKM